VREIIKVPIGLIKPYWRNPRENRRTIEALKKSIKRYGFNVPIVIDKENVIIAGHSRYSAMLGLGLDYIYCVVVDMPVEKAREYRIKDNKIQEMTLWDNDKLLSEIKSLAEEREFVNDFSLFFDDMFKDAESFIASEDIKLFSREQETEKIIEDTQLHTNKSIEDIQKEIDLQHKEIDEYMQDKIECPFCGCLTSVKDAIISEE